MCQTSLETILGVGCPHGNKKNIILPRHGHKQCFCSISTVSIVNCRGDVGPLSSSEEFCCQTVQTSHVPQRIVDHLIMRLRYLAARADICVGMLQNVTFGTRIIWQRPHHHHRHHHHHHHQSHSRCCCCCCCGCGCCGCCCCWRW